MLNVSGVGRTFGERIAVENVTFDVAASETFGLLRPNGAGKTTTLRMVAGLIPPTTGHVRLDGEVVNAESGADNPLTYPRPVNVARPTDAVEQQLLPLRSVGSPRRFALVIPSTLLTVILLCAIPRFTGETLASDDDIQRIAGIMQLLQPALARLSGDAEHRRSCCSS